jgi:hypothetical protein
MSQPPKSANLAAASMKLAAVTTDLRRAEMRIMELQSELHSVCKNSGKTSVLLSHCNDRTHVLPDLSKTLPSNWEGNPDEFPNWPSPSPVDDGDYCKAFRGFAELCANMQVVRVVFFYIFEVF